ncbi:MAG: HEAT repeat domain-containing protein [Anaerolineales bacterium]|nr:HEAT repeat domain-containing protein [Anaerolineales bacterium]
MNRSKGEISFKVDQQIWDIVEELAAPDPNKRDRALERLGELEDINHSPLILYFLATRLSDPDLEIRFHVVQKLGAFLEGGSKNLTLSDQALKHLQTALNNMEKDQLIKLLEVSAQYLSAEKSLLNILKLYSYAGRYLSGILNDRKQPFPIRQQAIFFSGEVGYLETKQALQNFIHRVDKIKSKQGSSSELKKNLGEEKLYNFAVSALDKMKS